MTSQTFDSIVVGGGVMGYSAAYYLAKLGNKTALLEQFPSPNTRGSSTGQSRITRVANDGNPAITPIMVDALKRWKEIQDEAGKQLFVPSKMLCVGTEGTLNTFRQSITESGKSPADYTSAHINETYGTNFGKDEECFMDLDAGVLLADKCILALKRLFEIQMGVVFDHCQVTKIVPGTPAQVFTNSGETMTANRIVICCGAWSKNLLGSVGVDLPLTPVRVAVLYWKLKVNRKSTPVFIRVTETDDFYGLPELEYPGLVKISSHYGIPCDPDRRDVTSVEPLVEKTKEFVKQYFPCLEPTPAIEESCMYTMTPDSEMILDHVPGYPNIAYSCGFSGSGFKLAPTVGELLSRIVTGQDLNFNVDAFSAKRFQESK